jgi:DNA-binding NtrC family response regulator
MFKILIAEYEEGNVMVFEQFIPLILENTIIKKDYKIITSDDGLIALNIIREEKDIDLFITNIPMPSLSGMELIKEVHNINPLITIIATSGYSIDDYPEIKKNIFDFWQKPFTFETFKEKFFNAVTNILEKKNNP